MYSDVDGHRGFAITVVLILVLLTEASRYLLQLSFFFFFFLRKRMSESTFLHLAKKKKRKEKKGKCQWAFLFYQNKLAALLFTSKNCFFKAVGFTLSLSITGNMLSSRFLKTLKLTNITLSHFNYFSITFLFFCL